MNIIFCNFGDKNPNEISRNDIYYYIYYEQQNFFSYFSTFLTELKDSFISQREVIDSILAETKEKTEKPKTQTDPDTYKLVYNYNKNKMVNFTETKIDGDQ